MTCSPVFIDHDNRGEHDVDTHNASAENTPATTTTYDYDSFGAIDLSRMKRMKDFKKRGKKKFFILPRSSISFSQKRRKRTYVVISQFFFFFPFSYERTRKKVKCGNVWNDTSG
jgi:hypothetical protein